LSPVRLVVKRCTQSSEICYNIQEGKVIERPKGRYISPVRIKNKQACQLLSNTSTPISKRILRKDKDRLHQQQKGTATNTVNSYETAKPEEDSLSNITLPIDSVSLRLSRDPFHRKYEFGGSVPYREKRNPLGCTRLSFYRPASEKEDNRGLPHYKSVDDFLFLKCEDSLSNSSGSEYSGDMAALIGAYHKEGKKPIENFANGNHHSINQSSTKCIENTISNSCAEPAQDGSETKNQPKNITPNDVEINTNYESTKKIKSKSIENLCKINSLNSTTYNSSNNNNNNTNSVGCMEATPDTTKKKDSSCFSTKIKAMSDRTHRLFSRLYTNASAFKPNQAETDFTKKYDKKMFPNISKNRRSFSYGMLPGIEEFQSCIDHKPKKKNRNQEPIRGIVEEEENGNNNNNNVRKPALLSVHDTEDGDSGILVNESGASSMLETDDVFLDESQMPSLPINISNDSSNFNKEFKLIRLKLKDEDCGLGLVIKQIKTNSYEGNNRYEVAHIVPESLAAR
jgi:hypothetical protein